MNAEILIAVVDDVEGDEEAVVAFTMSSSGARELDSSPVGAAELFRVSRIRAESKRRSSA